MRFYMKYYFSDVFSKSILSFAIKWSLNLIVAAFLIFYYKQTFGGGLTESRAELESILGAGIVLEDFESVEPNIGNEWNGPVLDSTAGIIEGIVFSREPSGILMVRDPLHQGGNKVLEVNRDTISIDFISATTAFGFDFDRATNTETEVTLNIFAEDDVTLLSTETISLFFDGFIGFSDLSGIGRATVSSFSVTIPHSMETRIDNVTFGGTLKTIQIDIRPKSEHNIINQRASGVIPVAILTSEDFDALSIDPETVEFGPGRAVKAHKNAHVKDIDEDGDVDLVLHFHVEEANLQCGVNESVLIGRTWDNTAVIGVDSVNIIGCR